ncbi:MAG: F0F1 ATP synthase subunit alpha [Actinobacteria bacterium]|nr:F0F1 ATP synthase subunit alpha [Actinomycetota bacterium]
MGSLSAAIRTDKIAELISSEINKYKKEVKIEEVGTVIEAGDGIARISGLSKALSGEMLEFKGGIYGQVLNLDKDEIGAIILGESTEIEEGTPVKCTGRILEVPVGEALLGRIIDPMGKSLDDKGAIKTDIFRPIEYKAPSVINRQKVKEPLQTGIKAIDSMIPIGKGQRELVIGDRSTGKTSILIDTIINQKGKNVFCIYVAIGQKNSNIARLAEKLEEVGAMEYTVIVNAPANAPAAIQYLAPYAGCAIGEYFMYKGQHALVIYDDLSKHAVAYRQISLLLRRPPGREAYPGDIFYLHSRLLERSAKLSEELRGGSLTSIPVVEILAGDISSYIPTNVISITDGQIYLETDLFNAGVRPAINAGISVSRVGGNAQTKAMKKVTGMLRLGLAQYRELETFAKFGTELDKETRRQLARGERTVEVLKQNLYQPVPVEDQVIIIFALTRGFLDDIELKFVNNFEKELISYMHNSQKEIMKELSSTLDISTELENKISGATLNFKKNFLQ